MSNTKLNEKNRQNNDDFSTKQIKNQKLDWGGDGGILPSKLTTREHSNTDFDHVISNGTLSQQDSTFVCDLSPRRLESACGDLTIEAVKTHPKGIQFEIFNGLNRQRCNKSNINICNNCGKPGHLFHQCKMPITSIGIVTFRIKDNSASPEYLLIRRKETLGYIDFMRGKYSVYNKDYIMNMLKQMTNYEKNRLCLGDFNLLWKDIWGDSKYNNQYKSEEIVSREKYKMLFHGIYQNNVSLNSNEINDEWQHHDHESVITSYTLRQLIEESNQFQLWEEPEWGFPKGRRNNQENDYDCAMREFKEETGYNPSVLTYIQNVLPLEEIFLGSNYKSYKHKYFLMYMDYAESLKMGDFQISEVSKVEWKTYEECVSCFRPYNLEKIRILTNINNGIKSVHIQDNIVK